MKLLNKFFKDESGATAIEYGLIAALVAVASITALNEFGDQLSTTFQSLKSEMADAGN